MLEKLAYNIKKWRSHNVETYHLHIFYMGGALNRVGDHELNYAAGKLTHKWKDTWREIEKGKDYWLFSVPGAFAWARDLLKETAGEEIPANALTMEFDEEFGFVKLMKVNLGRRNLDNFTFEVRKFTPGPHPDFE